MTVIGIQGMQFFRSFGLYQAEKKIKQELIIDLWLNVSLDGKENIRLEDTIDYTKVYEAVKEILENAGDILEQLAKTMQASLISKFPNLIHCKVRITKFPVIGGPFGNVFVEID